MILITSLSLVSCHDFDGKTIVGKWERQSNDSLEKVLNGNKPHWGDITFLTDSTFTIHGDSQKDTSSASVPGWHVGGQVNGKYRIEENYLYLTPEEWNKTLFSLNYQIIELTKRKLVLLSTFDIGDTTKRIVYTRYE
jgi:hypothetical protein